MRYVLLAAALALPYIPAPAFASTETEVLKQEIKRLEARIEQLEKREQNKMAAAAPSAGKPSGNVEQRLSIVERNQEIVKEEAQTKAAITPTVEIGSKGLSVTSADKQYSLRMRAYVQADNRTFFDSSGTNAPSTFLIRAARPIIEAKMTDYFNGRIMMDFGQGNTRLLDAYGDFHPMPGNDIINLRAGEFKVPIGIERWQAEQEILFTERGMTTNLVPFRDIGAMAYGQLIPDRLEYYAGIVNGASDLQVNTVDADHAKDFAGRVFAYPFRWANVSLLEGFGIGVGGTYGSHKGNAGASNLTTGYLSGGQRVFFAYRGGTFANGTQWRFNPQAMYYHGPLGIIGEYVLNSQEVSRAGNNGTMRNDAWMGIMTYVLTGEDASFDGVRPDHNFNPAKGDWGAFEAVGRVSALNVDNGAFNNFADATVSAGRAKEATVGGTWYFNPSVKLNVDYSYTTFDGGAAVGDRADEKVLMTRGQFRF